MSSSSNSKDALLTEHFRYTPLSLIDDIINTVNAIIYRAIQAIENGLLSTPPPVLGFGVSDDTSSGSLRIRDADGDGNEDFPEAREEIENGVHQLETLLEATVDKTFDRFEIYTLRNLLTVPDELAGWMRLGHYENLTLPLPPSAPTPESILQLRRTLQETQRLNLALQSSHAQNSTLISQLQALLAPPPPPSSSAATTKIEEQPHASTPKAPPSSSLTTPSSSLAFLTSEILPSHSASASYLTPSAQFSTSQLPAIRALLATLRPKIATLPLTTSVASTPPPAARAKEGKEERSAYIDSIVARVVRDHAVAEGSGGDGEGEGERLGRRIGGKEMRVLERILGGLVEGKGKGVDGEGDRDGDVRMEDEG